MSDHTETMEAFFTEADTQGYSAEGIHNLNRARDIILREHGLDSAAFPLDVREEIDRNMRDRLTAFGSDLSVPALLRSWNQNI